MIEYGVWSDAAGGFIETGLWSDVEAQQALFAQIRAGEDPGDLDVLPVCPDHEEQPARSCEECDAEEAEDED